MTPENTRSWFTAFYTVTEKSTPITMVFILVALVVGYMVTKKEIARLHEVNHEIFTRLEQKNDQLIKLAVECHKP